MANLKDTIVLGNLTVTGSVTASSILGSTNNATSADYPTGFASRPSSITWGTLAESTSYVTRWDDPSGGSVAFGHSGGKTSMQIDGYYYQEEGAYQVLDNRYMWNHMVTPNGVNDATGMVYVNTRMAIKGNGASYNEGLRILPASNGWSNIFFSGDDSLYNTHSGGWLLGRRGAAGTYGDTGDFTIENNGSNGNGLTLYANGSRPRWNGNELAYNSDIPTKTSQLTNDSKFAVQYSCTNNYIPKVTSSGLQNSPLSANTDCVYCNTRLRGTKFFTKNTKFDGGGCSYVTTLGYTQTLGYSATPVDGQTYLHSIGLDGDEDGNGTSSIFVRVLKVPANTWTTVYNIGNSGVFFAMGCSYQGNRVYFLAHGYGLNENAHSADRKSVV